MSQVFEEKAVTALAALGLTVAQERLDTACQQAAAQTLLSAEVEERHRRTVALNLKFARFPVQKRLEDFDFAAQPGLDRRLVEELATGRFLAEGL